jgi:uncharacterized protein (DUF433 family)
MATVSASLIDKTPGVCSGDARIHGTRIPVWLLVLHLRLGQAADAVLASYPSLSPADLDAAWDYYSDHPLEIEQTIWRADMAVNVPDGTPPPGWILVAGRLLGLTDAEICEAFDPPLTAAALAAAWQEYRADPTGIGRQIAHYRRAG